MSFCEERICIKGSERGGSTRRGDLVREAGGGRPRIIEEDHGEGGAAARGEHA